jgi:8-oxo-dGTP pyrophosphatase MutT (NUDIX family)
MKAVLFGPEGRVLLLHDDVDGCWEFPGGRLDVAERPVEGLLRELDEETGIGAGDVRVEGPVHTAAWRNDDGDGRFAAAYRVESTATTVALSEEHDEFAWTTPAEAATRLDADRKAVRALERAAARRESAADGAFAFAFAPEPESESESESDPEAGAGRERASGAGTDSEAEGEAESEPEPEQEQEREPEPGPGPGPEPEVRDP